MSDSVSFDRAAEYYDATRGLSDDGIRATTDALVQVFGGAPRPVLEVGVGTGQVAVPLIAAGMNVVGLDLSRPMLAKLLQKAGPAPALVQGDAARMPWRDHAFGGAYLRWVLHLIRDWRRAVAEIVRVVEPGGSFAAALGDYGGRRSEIQARFLEVAGGSVEPVGIALGGWDLLDEEMSSLGARKLPDLTLEELDRDDLETFVRGIERNVHSWTWAVPDDDLRARAATEARRWAEARWGPLDRVPRQRFEWRFARYSIT